MGTKDRPPTVTEWIKFPWEHEFDEETGDGMPTDKEIEHLRQLMREENAKTGAT
jgi:hypothetical protein